jgi:hypothetical protein
MCADRRLCRVSNATEFSKEVLHKHFKHKCVPAIDRRPFR